MNIRPFSALAWIAGAVGSSLFLVWSVTTNAAVRTLAEWALMCCGWIFSGGRIPPLYYGVAAALLGMLVAFGWQAGRIWKQTARWSGRLKASRLPDAHPVLNRFASRQGIRIDWVDSPDPVAAAYGFLHPRIAVSTALTESLTEEELEAVLAHEYHHCLKQDPLKVGISLAITRVLFFIPVLAPLRERFLLEKELEADRFACSQVGRKPLAGALYKLLKASTSSSTGASELAVGYHDGSHSAARVEALLSAVPKGSPISTWRWAVSWGMLGLIFLCLALLLGDLTPVHPY